MVAVGFIVEGESEKVYIESEKFKAWAKGHGIKVCDPVIDAGGGGNLLPKHLENFALRLKREEPNYIVILTDLEDAPSVQSVKTRIANSHTELIFIAVKAFEAWFLADGEALSKWLSIDGYNEYQPELTLGKPWDRLKELAKDMGARGPGPSKPVFANTMVNRYGFSIERAASHPYCRSAKYFYDGLMKLVE